MYITRPFTNMDRKPQVIFTDQKDREKRIKIPKKSLYLGEVEDLNGAILDGKDTLISLEETRNHVKTALALYQSARTGKPVHLSDMDQGL